MYQHKEVVNLKNGLAREKVEKIWKESIISILENDFLEICLIEMATSNLISKKPWGHQVFTCML
jgi:hypothetical protein